MLRFYVILFKNKEKKKIIKKFITFEKANLYFDKLIYESKDIIFDVKFENGRECEFELGLVEVGTSNKQTPIYVTDELGRNIKVKLLDDGFSLIKISKYKQEESIFDISKNKKITINKFISSYLRTDNLKVISVLNNKIVVQSDEKINIFSMKSENECIRLINDLSKHFFLTKRTDCLFIDDISTPQKKYLIKLLSEYGFSKKILYRKFTTYPRSK